MKDEINLRIFHFQNSPFPKTLDSDQGSKSEPKLASRVESPFENGKSSRVESKALWKSSSRVESSRVD